MGITSKILIIDFGSQYTQLIARKIRESNVYCEIYPYNSPLSKIKEYNADAIILSGGPSSVYDKNAPLVSKDIFKLSVPFLGICYGMQIMAHLLGGEVKPAKNREYGHSKLEILHESSLLKGCGKSSLVWMSHGDVIVKIPKGFKITAQTETCDTAAFEYPEKKFYGLYIPNVESIY